VAKLCTQGNGFAVVVFVAELEEGSRFGGGPAGALVRVYGEVGDRGCEGERY
jgi:hypothetical protein